MFKLHNYNKDKKLTESSVSTSETINVVENLLSVSYSDTLSYKQVKSIYTDLFKAHTILREVLSIVTISASKNTHTPLTVSFEAENVAHTTSFYLPSDNHIVILTKENQSYANLLGTVAHEFTHKALTAMYKNLNNIGAPYYSHNKTKQQTFQKAIQDTLHSTEKSLQEKNCIVTTFSGSKNDTFAYGKFLIKNSKGFITTEKSSQEECTPCEESITDKILNIFGINTHYDECIDKHIGCLKTKIQVYGAQQTQTALCYNSTKILSFYMEKYDEKNEHKELAVVVPENIASGNYDHKKEEFAPLYNFWVENIRPDIDEYVSGYQLHIDTN